jgi:hypothetical protein
MNLIGKIRKVFNGDNEIVATVAVYAHPGSYVVSLWEEADDRFQNVEEIDYDGVSYYGPEAKAARAMAIGCADSLAKQLNDEI